jgi:hypothetical protein
MKVNMDLTDSDLTMKVAMLKLFAGILDEEIAELSVGASAISALHVVQGRDGHEGNYGGISSEDKKSE